MSAPSHRRRLSPALALGALALLTGACGGGGAPAATEGISDRAAPPAVKVSAGTVGASGCFTSSSALPAGRDASGVQHYLLTFVVKGDPADEAALLRALDGRSCQQALQATVTSVTKAVTQDGAKAAVAVSYRTEKGRRFTLPG